MAWMAWMAICLSVGLNSAGVCAYGSRYKSSGIGVSAPTSRTWPSAKQHICIGECQIFVGSTGEGGENSTISIYIYRERDVYI